MSTDLSGFQLTEEDLSFLTSEELSPEEYLWSQIELCANASKFELCESLTTLWINKYLDTNCDKNSDKFKIYVKKISEFLLKCFQDNYENENIWFIYQMIRRFKFDHLVDRTALEIDLILRDYFDVTANQVKSLLTVSKLTSCDQIDDKVIIILKNLILSKPKIANLLIDLFKDKNSFNFIYSQSLIHALKNDNKPLILDLLTVFPDHEIERNVALLEEVCDHFNSDETNEFSLYKSVLLRQTPKLIQKISDIKQQKSRKMLYDFERHNFDFKESFLLATNQKKHFLVELLDAERVAFDMAPKQGLFFLIYALHKSDLKIESFDKIETNITKLVTECEEIQSLAKSDPFIRSLVKRLRFILNFTKWCIERMDNSSNTNTIHSRFNIFRALFSGESPLKILLKHGFLSNKSEVNENLVEDICQLLSECNESELMIYRGFLAIRHTIMWIILSETESFEDQIAFVLKKIFPINFRVEILENIFSLLFLTQNELIDNETDEDDYTEETNVNKEFGQSSALVTQASQTSNIPSGTPYFLCPNCLVPQLLSMLKDIIIDSQASLFSYNYKKTGEIPKVEVKSSIKDLSECKTRLERLMKYVSEAQWRYDVIEPAFNKNILTHNKKKSEFDDKIEGNGQDLDYILDEKELSRSFSSGSDNEKRSTNEIFSSLISCMLASPKQLLRYSLLEGQIERAKQVVKLFEHSLKNSEEVRELEIICKLKELSSKLKTLSTPQKSINSSKIGELAATGLRATQIQSLVHEFMFDLQVSDRTKNSLVVDFALTTSPSIDISEIILDSILQNQKVSESFPEKINSLLIKMRSMITELSKEYDNKSISFAQILTQFVEKDKFWDSNAFKDQKRNEKQLKIAFEELNKHLTESESKDDFETSISSPMTSVDSMRNLKRTSVLFEKLLRVCSDGKLQYLKVLFYYVRKVSKALNECRKNSHIPTLGFNDSSYFSILKQSPSAILCSMVLKDGISPKFVDDFAKEMKVDLIGTLCSVLCPKIPSHLQNDCSINEFVLTESCHPSLCEIIESHLRGLKYSNPDLESLLIQNHFKDETDSMNQSFIDERVRNIDLINYFYSRSPLLVELMKMLRLVKDVRTEGDFKFSPNSPLHKWVEIIKSKFECTQGIDKTSVLSLAFWPQIVSSNSIVMKTLEHLAIKGSLLEIYDLFQYIEIINTSNSSFISTDSSFKTLRNAILSRLALEQQDVKYALQIIDDPNTKCEVIIELIEASNEFELDFTAIRTLKCCLSSLSDEMPAQDTTPLKNKLISKINEIDFYSKIGHLTGLHSWKDAKHNLKGVDILTIIKTKRKYPMAVDWFQIQGWETETSDLQYELLILSYCQQNDLSALTQLLLTSDTIQVNGLSLIGKVLNLISNFDLRLFLIEFILNHFSNQLNDEMIAYYNNYIIGIKLIKGLDSKIQNNYMTIISKPILIVEQMLMNLEYEALEEAVKILDFDYLIESYAKKAVEIQIYDMPSAGASVISDATLISSTFLELKSSPKSFSMPEYIPTKDQWIPDSNVTHCMLCQFGTFSMLNRRHHCRRCGRVVCSNCSQNTLLIREIKTNSSVRVCDECYVQTQKIARKESVSSESSSLNRPSTWILSLDDLQNDSLRMEFYYDSSPSVSLCLTLLKLHSNRNRCCKVIVDTICKPLLETVVSSQVDYGLVIGMIRSLLVSTRISMEEQKSELMDQLNHLLGRLDVIRMLINSNCNTKELISYALSTNENSILKLQERLIEMERFELARDLATKFGLDSNSIFKTWAFICLKQNQFSEARDKFRLVFDKNNSNEGNRNLENIINVLLKRKYWSNTSLREDCLQIKKGKFNSNETNSKFYNENDLQTNNPKIFTEVMYYLEEYGTNEEVIKFYIKSSVFKPAITLFLNNCNSFSNNFFMKELFMSSLKKGFLSQFLRDLKACDPALSRVWKYLLAACKYLSANHMFHVLHVLQVFMGDHLRAAITQINCFFLTPTASDYRELYLRLDNLQIAKQHCTDFLSLSPNEYRSGCLIMDREEVMRQLRSLNIQIDITIRFHEKRVKGFLPNAVYSADESRELKNPPTILDHNKSRKTQLSALVAITYGQQISEGFSLTQMIIKDHNLDSAQVYRLSGRALVQTPQIKVIDSISQLLHCIRSSYVGDTILCDDVIGASIRSCSDTSLVEPLIKLLSNDVNKFDAYILSGKLRSAYLLAICSNRETDVLRVLEASKRGNDNQITKICELWLKKKSKQ